MSAENWRRVSRDKPCPICGKPDWCCRTADGAAACCMRAESAKPLRNGGWLHRLRDAGGPHPRGKQTVRRAMLPTPVTPICDFGKLAAAFQNRVRADALSRLAGGLGVADSALARLGIGWDGAAWTFPMKDPLGRIIGIRRRFPDGRKLSVKGGHEGLFIPTDLSSDDPLLICEGPTDTAALLTLDFAAVGRPSCTGGVKLSCEIARGREVVVVADGDEPGRRGAATLARVLALYCPTVRVLIPPSGVKDAREWVQRGATRMNVLAVIESAELWKIKITAKNNAAG